MSGKKPTCWICGSAGPLSKEHRVKRTDLQDLFGKVSAEHPLYFHNNDRRNQRIISLKNDRLKSGGQICISCNSARTQPHDDAWTKLSRALRRRLPYMEAGQRFSGTRVFAPDTRRQMLYAHLYFVKLFGCHIADLGIAIDLAPFRRAIVDGEAHPRLYLTFGFGLLDGGQPHVGSSDIEVVNRKSDGAVLAATWFQGLDRLSVRVTFAEAPHRLKSLKDSWHPKLGTTLTIVDYTL
jgi:hypothetical protein